MVDENAAGTAPAETVSAGEDLCKAHGCPTCYPPAPSASAPVAARLFRAQPPLSTEAAAAAGLKLFFVTESDPAIVDEQRGFQIWALSAFDACQLAARVFQFDDAPPLWATELQPLDMAPRYAGTLVDAMADDWADSLTHRILDEESWLLLGDWEDGVSLIAPHADADFQAQVKATLQQRLTEFFRQFLGEFPDALEQSAKAVEGDAYRWDGPALEDEEAGDKPTALQEPGAEAPSSLLCDSVAPVKNPDRDGGAL